MSNFIKYILPILSWIAVTLLLGLIVLNNNEEIQFLAPDCTLNGLKLLVLHFQYPLYFLATGIPLYGLYLTYLRMKQTDEILGQNKDQLTEIHNQYFENKISRIETTFFKLIELNAKYIENLNVQGFGAGNKGRNTFSEIHSRFSREFLQRNLGSGQNPAQNYEDFYIDFLKSHTNGGVYLDQFFNNILNVLNHIDKNENEIETSTYINLLRSQLSKFELFFILYQSISKIGIDLRHLVKKYQILKYLDRNEAVKSEGFITWEIFEKELFLP